MEKLDYRKTFLIGFGFLASSLAWSLYNTFVPVLLNERYIQDTAVIGFIMTIDNIFGVIFQPLVGQVSDRTRTRFGKRMPYIMLGIPVCAFAFFFIPRTSSLAAMMAVIIIFNLVMSLWRSPVVSLMPDLTPPFLRSKANGVINMMGGIGGIIAFLVGGMLSNWGGDNMPFLMGSVVMILALVILFIFIKEPDSRRLGRSLDTRESILARQPIQSGAPDQSDVTTTAGTAHEFSATTSAASALSDRAIPDGSLLDRVKERLGTTLLAGLSRPEKRSLAFLLLAIFSWFCGFNAIETFFSLYATVHLGMKPGDAAIMLSLFSITLIVFAIPSGILAGRVGRKRMIMIGLSGMVVMFLPMLFIGNVTVLRILLLLGGIFWACVNINSLPMVVELATKERIGSFTGYYYFFSFSAAIISPTLFGWIRNLTDNYATLFVYAVVAFLVALVCMVNVRHGEAKKPDADSPPASVPAA